MTKEIALLAPEIRAETALAFADTKTKLQALAQQSVRIVDITGKPGYDECHSARMVLKNTRVDIQKRGKEARDDATKFSKAVIAKEKELIDIIEPEEARLQQLQEAWDAAREAERQAAAEAERLRVAGINEKIDAIRALPASLVGKPSVVIKGQLAKLRSQELGADFAELLPVAQNAHAAALAKIEEQLQAQLAHETEQARIKAEREELERLREADRLRREKEERDAAAARAEQERQDRERRVREEAQHRQRLDAEARERAAREAQERQQREAAEAEARRQREAEERARREEEARQRAAEEERLQAERDRLAEEQRQLEQRQAEQRRKEAEALAAAEVERRANLTLRGAAQAVVEHFAGQRIAVVDDLAAVLSNERPATSQRSRSRKAASA